MRQVTDPEILSQLNGTPTEAPKGLKPVTDPTLLAQLEGGAPEEHPLTMSYKAKPYAVRQHPLEIIGAQASNAGPGLWEGAKPVIEGAALVGGGAIGTPLGPVGQVAGAGLAYAGVKRLEKAGDVYFGKEKPETLSEAFINTGKDVLTGSATEAGGQAVSVGINAALKGAGWTWGKLPTLTKEGLEKESGRILIKNTSEGPIYAKNEQEAAQIEAKINGLRFTRGQRTNDPRAIMQERALARNQAGTAGSKEIENRAASNEAIRNYYNEAFPENAGVEDVLNTVKRNETGIQEMAGSAQKGLEAEKTRLGSGMDVQQGGRVIKEALQTAKDSARAKAKELYDAIPDVKLSTEDIDSAIKGLNQDFQKSGDSLKDYPKGIINQIQQALKPVEKSAHGVYGAKSQGLVDQFGRTVKAEVPAKPQDIGFQELRGLRTQIREATQDAERGANPNYKLARRLKVLQDAVEKTINKMEGAEGDAAKAFREASAYYRQYDNAFRKGTVADILRPGARGEESRIGMANIAKEFFNRGNLDAADDFIRAAGNNQNAKQAIKDYASQDLLSNATDPMTGSLSSKKLATWLSKNKAVLQKFGLQDEYKNIVRAQKQVDAVKGLSEQFNKSVAAKMLNADPEQAISRAFAGNGRNTAETMQSLMDAVKGDKSGEKGLQKAFGDFILKQTQTTAKDLADNPVVSVARFTQIMRQYEPAMKILYKDAPEKAEALKTINRAYEIMIRNQRSPLGGGSDTAENLTGIIQQVLGDKVASKFRIINFARSVGGMFDKYSKQQINEFLTKANFDPEYAETLIRAAKGEMRTAIAPRIKEQMATLGVYGTDLPTKK